MERLQCVRGYGVLLCALVIGLALAGCEGSGSPAAPEQDSLDEVEARALLQQVAEEGGVRLPSLPHLLREARAQVRETGDAEARALFQDAHELRVQARDAFAEGDRERARELVERARLALLGAVVTALGDPVAADAVAAVEEALALFRERVADRELPETFQRRLDAMSRVAAEARGALDRGDAVGALDAALRVAAALRGFAPRDRESQARDREVSAGEAEARVALEAARERLAEARAALGAADRSELPGERVIRALRQAERHLTRAGAAFRDERYEAAIRLARESYVWSNRLIRVVGSHQR